MGGHPIRILVTDDLHRRRWTTLLRAILAFPHYVWLFVWTLAALPAAFVNWVAVILLGRSPALLHRFLAAYVKYVTQLYAYVHLAAEPYPSFDGPDGYPVDLLIPAPERQSRWSAALRLLLAVPALAIASVLTGTLQLGSSRNSETAVRLGLLGTAALLAWFAILVRGSMPRGLRDAVAWALSYGAQVWGYVFLLTGRYPDSDPALIGALPAREDPVWVEGPDDLRRSRATVLFRLPLAFPHLLWLTLWTLVAIPAALGNWVAALATGRPPRALHGFLCAYVRYWVSVLAFLYLTANPFPGFTGRPGSYPLDTITPAPGRQPRATIGFRLLLAFPAMLLSSSYGALLGLAAFFAWFAALVTAKMPGGLRNASALALRYQAQASAYVLVLTDAYPYSGPAVRGTPPAAGGGPARMPVGDWPALGDWHGAAAPPAGDGPA